LSILTHVHPPILPSIILSLFFFPKLLSRPPASCWFLSILTHVHPLILPSIILSLFFFPKLLSRPPASFLPPKLLTLSCVLTPADFSLSPAPTEHSLFTAVIVVLGIGSMLIRLLTAMAVDGLCGLGRAEGYSSLSLGMML